ncbi:hypothetical protein AAHC03_020730 [Spirometra sp. Aus1]
MSVDGEMIESGEDLSALIPTSARHFLVFVGAVFVTLLIFLLYLEKFLCFRICQGHTCFDPKRTNFASASARIPATSDLEKDSK